jgi:hypothetical protein
MVFVCVPVLVFLFVCAPLLLLPPQLPFNLQGTFHTHWELLSPSRPYLLARDVLPAAHGMLVLVCYAYLFWDRRRENPLF